jgi:hypothetical protein
MKTPMILADNQDGRPPLPPAHGSAVPTVGTIGEFTNTEGKVCQCVVRGYDSPPWDNICLLIDYVHPDGRVIKNAMIGVEGFRADATYQPNK